MDAKAVDSFANAAADLFCFVGIVPESGHLHAACYCRDTATPYVVIAADDHTFSPAYYFNSQELDSYRMAGFTGFLILAQATRVLAQSAQQARLAPAICSGMTRVVAPPAPPRAPAAAPKSHVLWMGRANPADRPERVIELARALPDVPFAMVLLPDIESYATRLRQCLPPNIRVTSEADMAALGQWIGQAALLVHTSAGGGVTLPLRMAWANAIPILSLVDGTGALPPETGAVTVAPVQAPEALRALLLRPDELDTQGRISATHLAATHDRTRQIECLAAELRSVVEECRGARP
ncbi:glycosyltransferase [Magnetospirillum moscoviense]|uniref:Glycosyl transferase family 28 C-terminal domain-containing protein n=1 Tax=Magnetospirillum moscoviense TaxID=1437059 RepID=A0A178MYH2_9PROT|nr:glycosyltransferase [Magnetospirillum moscoviense]OAN55075.1 hypothetical protein A6A05_00505 [Magnetospirillum moscoviense]